MMTVREPFEALYQQLQQHYQNREYSEALDLATHGIERYPEQRTALDYWRMTMAARTGDEALALEMLQEALGRGQWYSDLLLRRSPSFKSLQANPQFERLVSLNQEVAERDPESALPTITLHQQGKCYSGGQTCPLLVGLHAHAATAQQSLAFWAPVAAAGWLVAAPQSSQAIWKGAYVWDDRHTAESEITTQITALRAGYAVDLARAVIAGHSSGGETAIQLALRGVIEINRFLAIGPAGALMDDLDEWEPLLRGKLSPETRGAIIFGKEDASIPQQNIRKLVDRLNQAGVPCQLEIIPDVGSKHTPDYNPAVLRALAFLNIHEP